MKPSIRYRLDDEGKRHRVVVWRGIDGYAVYWTTYCTGCTELGEYGGNSHLYGYDEKAQCYVGAGCDECGYTGKRRWTDWVPFNLSEYPWPEDNDPEEDESETCP